MSESHHAYKQLPCMFIIREKTTTIERTVISDRANQTVLLCTRCDSRVTIAHRDDSNIQWYRCPTCGYVTTTKNLELTPLGRQLREAMEIQSYQNGERYVDPLSVYSSFCDNKGMFKPALVAEWIKTNHKFKTDRETEILYFYDGKVWQQNGESYLKEIVANLLGENDRKSHYETLNFIS